MIFKETYDLISYLHDYYPVKSKKHDEDSEQILAFKKGDDVAIKRFSLEMQQAMDELYSDRLVILSNMILCVVPAHEEGSYSYSMMKLASFLIESYGMIDGTHLIKRIKDHPKNTKGADRSIQKQIETLEINESIQIEGKDILILDDVSTTGNSIEAVRRLLKAKHAGHVYAQTIGKTYLEYDYPYYDDKDVFVYESSYYNALFEEKEHKVTGEAKDVLKQYFGFDSFLNGQEEIISCILSGRDVLAIMPTGSGKSICYQLPALMSPGITIIISPLISLMQDQVKALNDAGIHAGYINSSLTEAQISKVYSMTIQGVFKILYIAPERLESAEFAEFASRVEISMVTVDEAHCISQWGQDFRPSYLKIVKFVDSLAKRPVVSAFTATATEEVKTDISCVLKLQNPEVVVTGFDRENLYFNVEATKRKDDYVLEYVTNHPEESGIIYCATRNNVDSLYELLRSKGIPVARYHAGMGTEDRKDNQNDFIYDRSPVIVATNAFGMGIDKSNVRYVLHYNMPQSMENYYQEAGRAGRDGEPAQCIVLFSAQDIMINRFLLEKKDFSDVDPDDIELIRQRDIRRLQVMEGYCKTTGCLRNYILEYFGEKRNEPCDNCGNCHREFTELDMTEEAKKVINCVYESGGRYGLNIILGTLLGANRARLKEVGATGYRTYGCLKDHSEAELRLLINQLILDGYLEQSIDKYSVIRMGNIEPLRQDGTRILVKTYADKKPERRKAKKKKRNTDELTKAGYDLFEALRKLRTAIAREEGMPPYIVFSDKTLADMCIKVPRDRAEMLDVSGVGKAKYDKYGERFIEAIGAFLEENPDAVTSICEVDEADKTDIRQGDDQEDDSESYATLSDRKTPKNRRQRKKKIPFCIKATDADKFIFGELLSIGEIRDMMNSISSVDYSKRLFSTDIYGLLKSEGYVEELSINGGFRQVPTQIGLQKGIQCIEKTSETGYVYTILKYPVDIQKIIVNHYINSFLEQDEKNNYIPEIDNSDNESFDRKAYNQERNLPKDAGASWTVEEDDQLDTEYVSGMSVSEIAKVHNRTYGAIKARLRRHGYVNEYTDVRD